MGNLSRLVKGALRVLSRNPAVSGRARTKLAWEIQRRVSPEITFRRGGFLWTGAADDEVTESIYFQDYDHDVQSVHIEAVVRWLDPARPVIVNIGANLGDVAIPLSRVAKRIVAVEPDPVNFARLRRNVQQNGLEQAIDCIESAVSERTGTASLGIPSQHSRSLPIPASGNPISQSGAVERVLIVPAVTLDDLLRRLFIRPEEVGLVWSGTAGFDSSVVLSGASLWRAGAPLLIEVWPPGLNSHGGSALLTEACQAYFTHVWDAGHPDRGLDPIGRLAAIIEGLPANKSTDVLLLSRSDSQ